MSSLDPITAALRVDDVAALEPLLDALPPDSPPLVPTAALLGASRSLALLLRRGHAVDAMRVDETTGLHLARDLKIVKQLLAAGADPNRGGLSGTMLHQAAANAGPPVIKALLAAGACPDAVTGNPPRTPLALACHLGRTAAVRALLARPPAPATCFLALAEAVQRGGSKQLAVLDTLLGVLSPDLDPPAGVPPLLHMATRAGNLEAVVRLLAAGARIDRPDERGDSPACVALTGALLGATTRPGALAVLARLVAAGADLDRPCAGSTIRELARSRSIAL